MTIYFKSLALWKKLRELAKTHRVTISSCVEFCVVNYLPVLKERLEKTKGQFKRREMQITGNIQKKGETV